MIILVLFPGYGYTQQATFYEVEAMLEGVDLDALNTKRVITCRRVGRAKEEGVPNRADPTWMIATQQVRDRLQSEVATLNVSSPAHEWTLECRPSFTQFVPTIITMLGGAAAAETARWYPSVTVVIDGESVRVTDFDERRRYATCQPYRPDGFRQRSFIKAGC